MESSRSLTAAIVHPTASHLHEPTHLKTQDLQVKRSYVRIAGLFFIPVVGQVVYLLIKAVQMVYEACIYKPFEGELKLRKQIKKLDLGLSNNTVRKIVRLRQKYLEMGGNHRIYKNNVLFKKGSVPLTMTIVNNKTFFTLHDRTVPDDSQKVKRSLEIDESGSPFLVTEVRTKEEAHFFPSDFQVPLHGNSDEERDFTCYVIRKDSDLKQLYPEEYNPNSGEVDVAFHVDYAAKSFIAQIITFGQELASRGYVNRRVNHAGFVLGRRGNDLVCADSMGVTRTALEYLLPVKDEFSGTQELHVFRFQNAERAKRFLESHVIQNVNQIDSHKQVRRVRTAEKKRENNIYSYADCVASVFRRNGFGTEARKQIGWGVYAALHNQRVTHTQGYAYRRFCSPFVTLSMQVARYMDTLPPRELNRLRTLPREEVVEYVQNDLMQSPLRAKPTFNINSRFVQPSTLHRRFVKEAASYVVVPPSS
ncbi:MAG: hypothetical protein MRY21_02105 [Simkaniaceae bacterium]|nr:hypothetical protein [Simkaniaceae bacterium]